MMKIIIIIKKSIKKFKRDKCVAKDISEKDHRQSRSTAGMFMETATI